MTRGPSWDDLLLQSEQLLRQQDQGAPLRIERDLTQVEHYAQRLLAKSSRAGLGTAFDADRLLASEGVDPTMLRKMIQTYELRPRPQDIVVPAPTGGIGEYVEQTQQALTVTGLQRAGRRVSRAFDRFLEASLDARWATERDALFDRAAPYSLPALPLKESESSSIVSASPGGLGPPRLTARAAGYAAVARRMVRGPELLEGSGAAGRLTAAKAATECAAAVRDKEGEAHRTRMEDVWSLLSALLASKEEERHSKGSSSSFTKFVAAARSFLEAEFGNHMRTVVRAQRGAAASGAAPSRLALVQAYLRVRLAPTTRSGGVLDFDAEGGAGEDTTWERVWTCLRAGFSEEAVAVLQASLHARAAGRAGEAPVLTALRAAVVSEKEASGSANPTPAALRTETERLLREAQRGRGAGAFAAQRLATHALLARSVAAADAVSQVYPAALPTIEDWLWLRLGLVGGEDCSLSDVQAAVQRCPPSHYAHGGREPLRYVRVLLLSQLWRESLEFLARDAMARPWRLDAVYVAAVLCRGGVLSVALLSSFGHSDYQSDNDLIQSAYSDHNVAADLIRRYARELLPIDVSVALDHYILAAEALGGSVQARGSLLHELLVESQAFRQVLMSPTTATPAPIALLFPDTVERGRVLEVVAAECAMAGRHEEAVELYAFCGRYSAALELVCARTVEESVTNTTLSTDTLKRLFARGDALAAAIRENDPEASSRLEAWSAAKAAAGLLAAEARHDTPDALLRLNELAFLPTEPWRVEACVARVRGGTVHASLVAALPALVLAAARALTSAGRRAALGALTSYASALAPRFSQSDFKELSALNARLGR